jgi:RTX calcium-binding nonapeptide repeat (4 copies)
VLRRVAGPALIAITVAAIATPSHALSSGSAPADSASKKDHYSSGHGPGYGPGPARHAGPPYKFRTELMGEFSNLRIRNQAILTRTTHGYRYWSGGQDNHIVVTLVDGGIKFRDTATESFKELSAHCKRQRVHVGVSAVCHLPSGITERRPLLVEIWPRLGDDFVDASTLPATFAVSVLSDEGNDTAYLGAGPDFFNGHSTRDKVWGGAGDDWIRLGLGNDVAYGGPGNDAIVGMQGNDKIYGGPGNDRIGGNVGSDRLWADEGADWVLCGGGPDSVDKDAADRIFPSCETVNSR